MSRKKARTHWEERQLKYHNDIIVSYADEIALSRKGHETNAEKIFLEVAKLKNLKLEKEYRIYIKERGKIIKFYFADFCDTTNKIVFEVDGAYHSSREQKFKDALRTRDLRKAGYLVFRISNENVFNGKTTEFLIQSYRSIGIII
jgi:very-short-patch-repair endonuclease